MAKQKMREVVNNKDPNLYQMANAVRTYYILEHRLHVDSRTGGPPCTYGCQPLPRWDGGVDAAGRIYDRPVWFDIVRYALAHNVSPILLVRGTFRAWNSAKPPYPNQFTNPLALERARAMTGSSDIFAENLQMENHRFKAAVTLHTRYDNMDVEAASRRVLHDPYVGVSPLYRYCVGMLGGALDVVERFRDEAFQMYVFDKETYDAAWGDLIPQELRAAASHFYQEAL
jgi:hypothetical protein